MSGAVRHRTPMATSGTPRILQTKCPCDRHTWNGQNWVADMNLLSCKDATKETNGKDGDICLQNTSNMDTHDILNTMPDDFAADVDGLKEDVGFHSTWEGNTCLLAAPFNVKHGHVTSGSGVSSATRAPTKSRKRPAIDPFIKLIEESLLDDACKRRTDLKSSLKGEGVPARVCRCGCHVSNGRTPLAGDESRNSSCSGELPRRSMLKLLLTEDPRPKVGSSRVQSPDPVNNLCRCQSTAGVMTIVKSGLPDEVSQVQTVQQSSTRFSENSLHKATNSACCRDVPGCKALPNLLQNYIVQLKKKHALMKQSLQLQESTIALLESEVKHISDTGHSSVKFQTMYGHLSCIKINKGSQQAELRRLQDKVNQQKKLHSTLSEGVSSTQKAEVMSAPPPCEARTKICVCTRNRPYRSTSATIEAPVVSEGQTYSTAQNIVSSPQTYSTAAETLVSTGQSYPAAEKLVSTPKTHCSEALVSTPQIYSMAENIVSSLQTYSTAENLVSTAQTYCSEALVSTPQTYSTAEALVSTPQTYSTADKLVSTPNTYCSAEALMTIDLGEIEPTIHPTMSAEQMDMQHDFFLSNDLLQCPNSSSTLTSNTCSPTNSRSNTPDSSSSPLKLTATSFSCPSLSEMASGPKSSNNTLLVSANGELTLAPPNRALPTHSGHIPPVVDVSRILSAVRNSAGECSSVSSPVFSFSSPMPQEVPAAVSTSGHKSAGLLMCGKDRFLSRLERIRRIRAAYAKLPPARYIPKHKTVRLVSNFSPDKMKA